MRVYNQPVELIVETTTAVSAKSKQGDIKKLLGDAGITVAAIKKSQAAVSKVSAKSKATLLQPEKVYVKTGINDAEMNPWDVAHQSSKALGTQAVFIEPDVLQEFVTDNNVDIPYKKGTSSKTSKASDDGFDPDWQPHKNIIWHLGDDYSQLKAARDAVASINNVIRIGHLDTGYSQNHNVIPDAIKNNPLQ